jgi:hypothetical protein
MRVRKTFCTGFTQNLQRELTARDLTDDDRLSPIVAHSGMNIYLPWYRDYTSFQTGTFRFYPLQAARSVIDFLEHVSRRGLAMIDINPGSFLYNSKGDIKVVDCEYLVPTHPESDFSRSIDYSGASVGIAGPRSRGWKHFWRDAVGAPYNVVRYGSPRAVAAWRAVQVLVRIARIPIILVVQGRQTVLAFLFYWLRRRPWGNRVL